jgi:anti-sigma regulatory factor (Ser/Thr protein kinase)
METSVHSNDSINSIFGSIGEEFKSQSVDSEIANDCYVIIDEFHANMREHVAPKVGGFHWSLNVNAKKQCVVMTFNYPGPCFDPTQEVDIAYQPISTRRVGGLGLLIMASLSDDISYRYHKGVNTLVVQRCNTEIDIPQENDPCR